MIQAILKNIGNIRTSVLGFASLLVSVGAALSAFADGDAQTVPNWEGVAIAASSFVSSLWLIFGSKD